MSETFAPSVKRLRLDWLRKVRITSQRNVKVDPEHGKRPPTREGRLT